MKLGPSMFAMLGRNSGNCTILHASELDVHFLPLREPQLRYSSCASSADSCMCFVRVWASARTVGMDG